MEQSAIELLVYTFDDCRGEHCPRGSQTDRCDMLSTSRCPSDLPDFCKKAIEEIA